MLDKMGLLRAVALLMVAQQGVIDPVVQIARRENGKGA